MFMLDLTALWHLTPHQTCCWPAGVLEPCDATHVLLAAAVAYAASLTLPEVARIAVIRPGADGSPASIIPAAAETLDGSRLVIVDGDTFAHGSEKVRISNIDAPESFCSRCEAELVAGLKAKERLAALLRSGLVVVDREGEDRYGRTLARVSVRGRDVGDTLVREGLAVPWRDGADAWEERLRAWCG